MPKRFSADSSGFTLIEITMVLVLLGILASVAVPKFFDLQEEAERKAVLASAAEVQSRLEATFANKVLEGTPCSEARTFAASISNLADDSDKKFGAFSFQASGNAVFSDSLSLKYQRSGEGDWKELAGFSLVLPQCTDTASSGFSEMGARVFNAFINHSFSSTGPQGGEGEREFSINQSGGWVTMQVSGSNYDGFKIEIGKDHTRKKVESAKLIIPKQGGGNIQYELLKLNLAQEKLHDENRDRYIETFKTICPNFDALFRIENVSSPYGGTVNKLVWSGVTSLQ